MCHPLTIFPWTRGWGLFICGPSICRLWTGLGFHPHWFYWETRIGHILWWAWGHYFFCLFRISPLSTVSDTSQLQPAPRALLSPVPLATKMSVSELIFYFSSPPAAFGFWSSSPSDNITLNPAKKDGWSKSLIISDCHWCGCSCHSQHRAAHFSHQRYTFWYHFLSTRFWERSQFSFSGIQVGYQDSWHSGQCCVQMGW